MGVLSGEMKRVQVERALALLPERSLSLVVSFLDLLQAPRQGTPRECRSSWLPSTGGPPPPGSTGSVPRIDQRRAEAPPVSILSPLVTGEGPQQAETERQMRVRVVRVVCDQLASQPRCRHRDRVSVDTSSLIPTCISSTSVRARRECDRESGAAGPRAPDPIVIPEARSGEGEEGERRRASRRNRCLGPWE